MEFRNQQLSTFDNSFTVKFLEESSDGQCYHNTKMPHIHTTVCAAVCVGLLDILVVSYFLKNAVEM